MDLLTLNTSTANVETLVFPWKDLDSSGGNPPSHIRKVQIPHPPGSTEDSQMPMGYSGRGYVEAVNWTSVFRIKGGEGCGHQRRLNYITSFLLLIDFINEAISRITPRDDRKRLINFAFSSQVFKHYFKHTEGNRRIENSTFQTGHLSQSVSVLHLTLVTNLIP